MFHMQLCLWKVAAIAMLLVDPEQSTTHRSDVHPGVAWGVGGGYSVGGRVAFDIGSATWGFTPLFNKGLLEVGKDATLFAELDIPIRFKEDGQRKRLHLTFGRPTCSSENRRRSSAPLAVNP